MTRQPEHEILLAAAQGMREILADMEAGRIPLSVTSFSRLHDYTDANVYAGLTEGARAHWDVADANSVQNTLHNWLASGKPQRQVRLVIRERMADRLDKIHDDIAAMLTLWERHEAAPDLLGEDEYPFTQSLDEVESRVARAVELIRERDEEDE